MHNLKTFEQLNQPVQIAQVIAEILETKPFRGMPLDVLNNGWCNQFRAKLMKLLKERGKMPVKLTSNSFQFDFDEQVVWSTKTSKQLVFPDDPGYPLYWNMDNLAKYGMPDVPSIDNLTIDYHEWTYVDGKHYDAESPDGVENFWDLVFFQYVIRSFRRTI